ncbi:MAG: 16S rRNA (uracil(1498)-N(3))-methyltransferase [Deltaproteobacteria bacterium]|nr:16S rRNA (uracil(1498)-N(3))-methyltransferase [Deltaproteobacteria bacterium]
MTARHVALRHLLVTEAVGAAPGALVRLDPDKAKHLRKVLRMEWDERVNVLDGAGRLLEGTLEKAGDLAAVRVGALLEQSAARPSELELVVALPKNATMDWVVEKAVECGATRVTPVVSSRSVVKPPGGDETKYVRRWQAIMDEAIEQSERLWRPLVSAPAPWPEYLRSTRLPGPASFVFLSELRSAKRSEQELLTECWKKLHGARSSGIRLMIGPEGGFSDAEREELVASGFQSVSLGNSVLRVETAVVAALTLARIVVSVS